MFLAAVAFLEGLRSLFSALLAALIPAPAGFRPINVARYGPQQHAEVAA